MYAAILPVTESLSVARVAPVPQEEFLTKLTYWQSVPSLSAGASTNWLLDMAPDIYMYGALVHSAPFLKEAMDQLSTWAGLMEAGIEQLHQHRIRQQWSGSIVPVRRPVIGG
jgi:hypothetical protein